MYYSRLYYDQVQEDKEYERTAWFTSMIMSSSGNYGKKGIDAKKLYKRQFDNEGEFITEKDFNIKSIDVETRDQELDKLMKQFNKTNKIGVD